MNAASNDNPYSPPTNAPAISDATPSSHTREALITGFLWMFVFGLNIIVPLMISEPWAEAERGLGIVAALVVGCVIGLVLCGFKPKWMATVNIGALFVGVSQVFPVIQVIAGMIAIQMTTFVGLSDGQDIPRAPSSTTLFVLTLITGSILITVSAVIGIILRSVQWLVRNRRSAKAP